MVETIKEGTNDSDNKASESSPRASEIQDNPKKRQLNFFTAPDRALLPAVVDDNVKTMEFLNGFHYFVSLNEMLGSIFVTLARTEHRNIAVVKKFYDEDPSKYMYIKEMLLTAKKKGRDDVVRKIVWMNRGIKLLTSATEEMCADFDKGVQLNIGRYFIKSYQENLQRYHHFIFRQLAKSALYVFMPSTEDSMKSFCFGEACESIAELLNDAKMYMANANNLINFINKFYEDNGFDLHTTVP